MNQALRWYPGGSQGLGCAKLPWAQLVHLRRLGRERGTDTGQVSVTVTPVADQPNAVDDALTASADTAGNVDVLANDRTATATRSRVTTLTPAATIGTVACTVAGICSHTPNPGLSGSDSFDYTITDGTTTDTATVLVTVSADTNTPPSCANAKPSRTKLWPLRHKFLVVTLSGATDLVVLRDRVLEGPDAQRVAGKPNQIKLRAERIASGNGRVYRIHYTVADGQGGTCSSVEKVGVPINKNGNAVDNVAKRYNSFG